jgi:hypothetical protein
VFASLVLAAHSELETLASATGVAVGVHPVALRRRCSR